MSEYQYYEFQAIDRRLTNEELAAIRKLSSRVELSATKAAFNYSYGSFRGDPLKVLEQYFDALLYIANWGNKQLAFRLPRNAIAIEQLRPYTFGDEESCLLDLLITPQHIILNFYISEEGYGWIEGAGLLDALTSLREAILRGDLRALYLFWLRGAAEQADWVLDEGEENEPLREPPVPPGLGQLDPALQAFAEFFEIDQDLIAAAAENSPTLQATNEPIEQWVVLLPEAERTAFLIRAARGEPIGTVLLRRLREVGTTGKPNTATLPLRTFAEIQAAAAIQEQRRIERERAEAERARLAKLESFVSQARGADLGTYSSYIGEAHWT